MKYRVLLLSVVVFALLAITNPAAARRDFDRYNLHRTRIHGRVESVRQQEAFIRMDSGEEIAVVLGPSSYWSAHGYYLSVGNYVDVNCWYDPDDEYTDYYFAGEISGDGFDFVLANDAGIPFWVVADEDYYYGLGYRSNCVSYMVWYDCPPTYFVYLSLPPPPPQSYTVYYGPQWQANYTSWNYGTRYASGGTYWADARGYTAPTISGRVIGHAGQSGPVGRVTQAAPPKSGPVSGPVTRRPETFSTRPGQRTQSAPTEVQMHNRGRQPTARQQGEHPQTMTSPRNDVRSSAHRATPPPERSYSRTNNGSQNRSYQGNRGSSQRSGEQPRAHAQQVHRAPSPNQQTQPVSHGSAANRQQQQQQNHSQQPAHGKQGGKQNQQQKKHNGQ